MTSGGIYEIVPGKVWFGVNFVKELGVLGKKGTFNVTGFDNDSVKISLMYGENSSVTNRDKIAVRILLNLIEELREGMNVRRSEEELVEARCVLRKFLPEEAYQ